ncbi:MAG TPA: type II toxin-antitoxin system VapC family toxin [Candidatus Lokiarchaeia archaeon]|nr:type II toxin-antitoxin system VapC family toxin [Candidatus Lokiarchaeia archaeon]
MIFLDSDAIIAILRGKPAMAAFLAAHKNDIFAIAIPVLYEIYYGFYFPPLSQKFRDNARFLQRLQDEQRRMLQLLNDIQVFELTLDAIKTGAEIAAKLDAEGNGIGSFDSLIAGIIIAAGHDTIVSNNQRHYERIPDFHVLNF